MTAPQSYHREVMGSNLKVMCVQYEPATDELIGPAILYDERLPDSLYMVTNVQFGDKTIMEVDKLFDSLIRVPRTSVSVIEKMQDYKILWQSSYQVWATEEQCLIGALVTPLLDTNVVFEWFAIEGGKQRALEMSTPFVYVGPGSYTAKITFFHDGFGRKTSLPTINVRKGEEFFTGTKVLQPGEYEVYTSHRLGHGGFGNVYRGKLRGHIAVKILKTDTPLSMLETEVNMACKLRHRNLVSIEGVCLYPNETHIIMEYIHGKNLDTVSKEMEEAARIAKLETNPKKRAKLKPIFTSEEKYYILQQICLGLWYLHSEGVIHLDMKPANVLVQDDLVVKITDFGISRVKAKAAHEATMATHIAGQGQAAGTLLYMAPEVYEPTEVKPQGSADVWGLGLIAIELFNHGNRPFKTSRAIDRAMLKQTAPPGLDEIDESIQPIVRQAVSYIPGDRPSPEEFGKFIGGLYEEEEFFKHPVFT